jgi:hypothetical protein
MMGCQRRCKPPGRRQRPERKLLISDPMGRPNVDWSKVTDLEAILLLTCAFGAVARRSQTQVSGCGPSKTF